MAHAYLIGSEGHFVGCEPIVSADDSDATEEAKRLVDGHDVELWNGTKLVARLHHQAPPK
jgi:hypothetical protein